MQLAAKIINAKKISNNRFELNLRIEDTVEDTTKISRSVKNREISIVRDFSSEAPEPSTGQLIVLDVAETAKARAAIMSVTEEPLPKKGEAVSAVGDFNSDGYDELHMANETTAMQLSPKRGGMLTHIAARGCEGLIDGRTMCGVGAKLPCGIYFDSAKSGFDIAKADFHFSRSNPTISRGAELQTAVSAKISGLSTKIILGLKADCPAVNFDLRISNNGKKAKSKKIHPIINFRLMPVGQHNSQVVLASPPGEELRYAKRDEIPVWAWHETWYFYVGDIRTDNSGFIIARREDTGEALLISFDPKQIIRLWHDQEGPLPQLVLFSDIKNLRKGADFSLETALCPLENFAVADGYAIGYIRSGNSCHIITAGPKPRKLVIDGEEIMLSKIGPTLYQVKLDKTPGRVEFAGNGPVLRPVGG